MFVLLDGRVAVPAQGTAQRWCITPYDADEESHRLKRERELRRRRSVRRMYDLGRLVACLENQARVAACGGDPDAWLGEDRPPMESSK